MAHPVRYHVVHETLYDYEHPVSVSQQQLHLAPRILDNQRIEAQEIIIDPVPSWRSDGHDAFGNPVSWVSFHTPHPRLWIRSTMDVAVKPRGALDLAASLPWETLRDRLAYASRPPLRADLAAMRFLFESPHVRIKHDLADYAADCFPPETPVLVGARALMDKIFREFTFDPEATTVSTPVLEVLEKKRGVCQDFAHLMIAALRSIGLPARYMSGYLLTDPPPGKPRLVGADASHAWVAVWCPGHGWIEYDPTNGIQPDLRHVTLGWGRDFQDVSPLRGVILGGLAQAPEVRVTVMPEAEWVERQAQLEKAQAEARAKPRAKAPAKLPAAPDVEAPEG